MLPVVTIFNLEIGVYLACAVIGLFLAVAVAYVRLLRLGRPVAILRLGIALTILAGFGTMVVVNLAINTWREFQAGGPLPPESYEGMSVLWALVGGMAAGVAICRWQRAPVLRVFDLAILGAPLAQAIGRLGCWAAGCCYGKETEHWLGVYAPDDAGHWEERYPTQLISAVANLGIFFVLWFVDRRSYRADGTRQPWAFDGLLTLLYVMLFAAKRFFIALLRDSGAPLLGPFNWMQVSALLTIGLAALLWARTSRRMANF
jgi:phosphatidylglycerol:prolipoprotein diacylglycerol transferase